VTVFGRGFALARSVTALAVVAVLIAGCSSSGKKTDGAGSTSGSGSSAAAGTPIKIGSLGYWSGVTASQSTPYRDAVIAWSKSVNANGGINGHPVEVIVKDDANNPAQSQTMLHELVEQDGVVAIVGSGDANNDASWAPYLKQKKIPIIGGSTASAIWGTSPMYFKASISTAVRTWVWIQVAKRDGLNKVLFVYCSEAITCKANIDPLKDAAMKAGVTVTGSESVSATQADYSAVCLKGKRDGAQFIIPVMFTATVVRLAQSCTQQGMNAVFEMNSTQMNKDILNLPQMVNGNITYETFPASLPAAQGFRDAMQKYSPGTTLDGAAPGGWLGAALFQKAVENANVSKDATVTAQDVLSGLYKIKDDNLGGLLQDKITYTEGQPHPSLNCMFTAKVQAGGKIDVNPTPLCMTP
jgi:branched-chain amino acid transport system substrate-binding protein